MADSILCGQFWGQIHIWLRVSELSFWFGWPLIISFASESLASEMLVQRRCFIFNDVVEKPSA